MIAGCCIHTVIKRQSMDLHGFDDVTTAVNSHGPLSTGEVWRTPRDMVDLRMLKEEDSARAEQQRANRKSLQRASRPWGCSLTPFFPISSRNSECSSGMGDRTDIPPAQRPSLTGSDEGRVRRSRSQAPVVSGGYKNLRPEFILELRGGEGAVWRN